MKDEFVKWALRTPGVWNRSEIVLRDEMLNEENFVGIAFLAWKAAWRKRGELERE
jgi:hypothetical protein